MEANLCVLDGYNQAFGIVTSNVYHNCMQLFRNDETKKLLFWRADVQKPVFIHAKIEEKNSELSNMRINEELLCKNLECQLRTDLIQRKEGLHKEGQTIVECGFTNAQGHKDVVKMSRLKMSRQKWAGYKIAKTSVLISGLIIKSAK